MSRYRIRSSKLFLTYPQCTLSKEAAFEELTELFHPKELLVASEEHKNGDPHIHAYVELNVASEFTDAKFADIGGFHGNYQACRSAKNVVKYCTKADRFMSTFDVSTCLKGGEGAKAIIGKRIIEGAQLTAVVEEFPQYIFGYKKLKQDIEEYKQDKIIDERDDLPADLPNPWGIRMPVDTDNKQCHYWVYSKQPNKGKTTGFLEPIHSKHKAYWKDQTEPYWNIPKDTEIIIFDEFQTGQMKASEMNMICDGKKEFRIFMGGERRLDCKPLVIVCSNYSIKEVWPNMYTLVSARFNEINVD